MCGRNFTDVNKACMPIWLTTRATKCQQKLLTLFAGVSVHPACSCEEAALECCGGSASDYTGKYGSTPYVGMARPSHWLSSKPGGTKFSLQAWNSHQISPLKVLIDLTSLSELSIYLKPTVAMLSSGRKKFSLASILWEVAISFLRHPLWNRGN
jgi:hypothetical protein